MKGSRALTVAMVAVWLGTMPLAAHAADVSGTWVVSATSTTCKYAGRLTLQQSGANLAGSMDLKYLPSGFCLTRLSGALAGTIAGDVVSFSLNPNVGFSGTVASDGQSMGGSWILDSESGTWSAQLARVSAPVVSQQTLALLALLLVAVGVGGMMRRRAR
jgi:hypothetical protein